MNDALPVLKRQMYVSLALIPAYLILIAVFLFLNIGSSFNPPVLLLLFNMLFLGLIPLYVAYIAYKSFRGSGSNGVLLKGTGMLMLGLGAIAAGIVNYLPDSMNANLTVHNTSFCVGAFLQFVGSLTALSGTLPRQRPGDGTKIALIYGGVFVVFCSFAVATVLGWVPPFFIPGTGFTILRELVITGAILFFALASGILLWLYYRKREDFFLLVLDRPRTIRHRSPRGSLPLRAWQPARVDRQVGPVPRGGLYPHRFHHT